MAKAVELLFYIDFLDAHHAKDQLYSPWFKANITYAQTDTIFLDK